MSFRESANAAGIAKNSPVPSERKNRCSDMRLVKLPYVTLWASKFDETKKIYKEILNLPVAEENENFIMFDTKTYRLALHRLPKKSPALNRDTVELHFEANDVDQVYQSLRSKGVKFHDPPANRPWGTRMAAFKDPEGYTIEIVGPLKEGEPAKGN